MKGISFGEYHTYNDFRLVIKEREIEAPEPKTNFVEVEGADGSLDFSDVFGEIKFKRRTLKFKVTSLAPRSEFWTNFTEIQNTLHGKQFHIIDDEDPDYYYIGRVTIDKWSIDKVIGSFTITVTADPYKYHLYETVVTKTISGTMDVILKNDRMTATATVTATSAMNIIYGNTTFSIDAYTSAEIVLKEGNSILNVTGNGTLTVRYQEGAL